MSVVNWIGILVFILVFTLPTIGIVLITLGIRGRARFSSPTCAKCHYDLRAANYMGGAPTACPECGTDLTPPKAVSFGRYERSAKKIVVGIVLVLLAIAVPVGFAFVQRSVYSANNPAVLPSQTNAQVLSGLATTASQPWGWQELESRLKRGRLNQTEVDAAIKALIQEIKANNAKNNSSQPLHWANDFVKAAINSGMLSPQRTQELCETFFINQIRVEMPKSVRVGKPVQVNIHSQGSWDLGNDRMVSVLREVKTANGQVAGVRRNGAAKPVALPDEEFSSHYYGTISMELVPLTQPGDQELVFVFDAGAVAQNAIFRGKDGKPGRKDQWPNPLATWEVTVRKAIKVVPADQPAVTLDSDPAHDPQAATPSLVKQALVRNASKGVQLVLAWDGAYQPSPPIAGQLSATIAGKPYAIGQITWGKLTTDSGSITSWGGDDYQTVGRIPSLPADAKTVSITITPDPTVAEQYTSMHTIWSRPVQIDNVPLQRFDLEAASGPK